MARTRGAAKKEKEAPKSIQVPEESECDSTVRQWGRCMAPARKQRRARAGNSGNGVLWCDVPENALYKVFEALLQDKQGAQAFRNAAACCRTWRLASLEVLLDDTAASRPELPPMVVPEVEECKPTTATTCNAGLCDEAESETEVNGFEASSRELAKRRTAAAAAASAGDKRQGGRSSKRAGRSNRGAGTGAGGGAGTAAGPAAAAAAAVAAQIADAGAGGDSEQVTPGAAQRRRAGGLPPPPPAPLRHANDHPVFNTGASPEYAAMAAAAIAAIQIPRKQQNEGRLGGSAAAGSGGAGAGPSHAHAHPDGRPASARRTGQQASRHAGAAAEEVAGPAARLAIAVGLAGEVRDGGLGGPNAAGEQVAVAGASQEHVPNASDEGQQGPAAAAAGGHRLRHQRRSSADGQGGAPEGGEGRGAARGGAAAVRPRKRQRTGQHHTDLEVQEEQEQGPAAGGGGDAVGPSLPLRRGRQGKAERHSEDGPVGERQQGDGDGEDEASGGARPETRAPKRRRRAPLRAQQQQQQAGQHEAEAQLEGAQTARPQSQADHGGGAAAGEQRPQKASSGGGGLGGLLAGLFPSFKRSSKG